MNAADTAATAAIPARFWKRYAAWSLDFALLAPLAALPAWPQLRAGWHQATVAATTLAGRIGQALADALLAGTPAPQLSQALQHDPAILAAGAAMEAGLWRMLLPWLLAYALLGALWHVAGEASRWHGSAGKRALRLGVQRMDGGWPGIGRALGRHVACALSWLTLNLGHALAAVPPQKRALHDYVAATRVVDLSGDPRLPPWARGWIALQAVAGLLLAGWLLSRYFLALQGAMGPA